MQHIQADMKLVGESIHAGRVQAGISALSMAQQLSISVEQLSRIERGEHTPTLNLFLNICIILRMSPDVLLEECLADYTIRRKAEEAR